MGSLVLRVLGVFGAAILSVLMFGGGVASADALSGKTYDEAVAAISSWKGTPVIATVSGDQLETNDCIVTSFHVSIFLDASGDNNRGKNYLLNLNCNNRVASPGHPGNSMMAPDAALAKKELQAAANIKKDPSYCDIDAGHARSCAKICKRTGMCEFSLDG
jgi:hypothetical protein